MTPLRLGKKPHKYNTRSHMAREPHRIALAAAKERLINRRSANALDVTGQRYGKLVALKPDGSRLYPSGQKRTIWLFRCDCGKEVNRTLFDVRRADTKSCGCLRIGKPSHNRLPSGEASFNGLFAHYKNSARHRKLSWELSKDDFRKIVTTNCYYCGTPPLQRHLTHASANGHFLYNGIDRVKNSLGYTESNTVTACCICNRAKNVLSSEEFLDWIRRIVRHVTETKK